MKSKLRNYEKAYLGRNAACLQAISQKYDPLHGFPFPQSVR
ncbi:MULTISPECIES: BBE domain-containing protein [Paenibacillus]